MEDATDILCHLLDKKINFHLCRNLTNFEHHGTECAYSNHRIEELKAARAELMKTLQTAKLTGKNLQVNSEILLSLTDAPITSPAMADAKLQTANN